MEIRKTLYVTSREEWRAWLTKHYQSETEVWLIYYKKHSGQPRIPYDHAVEEALCFGWIGAPKPILRKPITALLLQDQDMRQRLNVAGGIFGMGRDLHLPRLHVLQEHPPL